MTDAFKDQPTFKPWNIWLMRNCAGCSVVPCNTYLRNYALEQTWGKDFTMEPDCPLKVSAPRECSETCQCGHCKERK